jgi:hypothetical protein
MVEMAAGRREAIRTAINAELQRQALAGAHRVDTEELAAAVEEALDPDEPVEEGKRPQELNATNDD